MTSRKAQFEACVGDFLRYPHNLSLNGVHPHTAKSYEEQLNVQSARLFGGRGPQLRCYDVRDHAGHDCQPTLLADLETLKSHLSSQDPLCRVIVVRARSQRLQLCTSQDAFKLFMSHHLVMPAFLEFVFPFGKRMDGPGPYTGGFRTSHHFGLHDESMGRSQQQLEMCYTLQAPERSNNQPDPWSIRQCSVWHNFDLKKERQTWIVVKANEVVEEMTRQHLTQYRQDKGELSALHMSLDSHFDICQWSAENWQWYLTFLEEQLQASVKPADAIDLSRNMSRRNTISTMNSRLQSISRANTAASARAWLPNILPTQDREPDVEMGLVQEPESLPEPLPFSLVDLRRLQLQEEIASNSKLILQGNAEVAAQLRREYQNLRESRKLGDGSSACIASFEQKMTALQGHFKVLLGRVDAHLKLVSDKKGYMYGLLQYENMQSTLEVSREAKELSADAKESAERMEVVTKHMHEIAKRTEDETVRMRIITAVTLFFLPGTFVSTLMSTDIVWFPEPPERDTGIMDMIVGSGALQVYVIVSVPLMILTFMSWYIMSWWETGEDSAIKRIKRGLKWHA